MAVKKIYDMVCTVGKYTDKQGNEKNETVTIGKMIVMDDGKFFSSVKSFPVSALWDGTIHYYEQKPKETAPVQQSAPPQNQSAPPEDDLPF